MNDLSIDEADFTRLIVEIIILKLVSGELLEPSVGKRGGIAFSQAPLATRDHKRSVFDRQTLGEIGIMGQCRPAVADGKE